MLRSVRIPAKGSNLCHVADVPQVSSSTMFLMFLVHWLEPLRAHIVVPTLSRVDTRRHLKDSKRACMFPCCRMSWLLLNLDLTGVGEEIIEFQIQWLAGINKTWFYAWRCASRSLVAKDTLTSTRILANLTFSYLAPANHHFLFLLRHANGCGVVTKSWSLHMTFVKHASDMCNVWAGPLQLGLLIRRCRHTMAYIGTPSRGRSETDRY